MAKNNKPGLARAQDQSPQVQQNQPVQAPPSEQHNPGVGLSFTAEYEGPILPQQIAAYERTELGREYVTEIIEQGRHRRHLEKTVIEGDNRRADRGQVIAGLLALNFLLGGFTLVLNGHDVAGASIATVSIVGLVGAFLKGVEARKSERLEKTKILVGQQPNQPEGKAQGGKPPRLPR